MQDASFLQLLQEKLLEKIGYQKANYTAVAKLSQSIEDTLGEHISETTLKRIFNLIPVQSEFRTSTLDILAQYIGYATWDKFKAENDFYAKKTFQPTLNQILDETRLLKICLKNHHFDTVLEYINQVPVPSDKKRIVEKLSLEYPLSSTLWFSAAQDKVIFQVLIPELAKMPAGQYYFYEAVPNSEYIPFLKAMEQHYARFVNFKNKEYGLRDYVFTQAMLYKKFSYENKPHKAHLLIANLYKKYPFNKHILEEIRDDFPIMRYTANYLLYLHQKNSLTFREMDKIFSTIEGYCTNETYTIVLKALFETNPEYALPKIKNFLQSNKIKRLDGDIIEFFYKIVLYCEQQGSKHTLQEILLILEQKMQELNNDFCLSFLSFEPKTQKQFLYIKRKIASLSVKS